VFQLFPRNMTKQEEKNVLALLRMVKTMCEATEKTSGLVQRDRYKELEKRFSEIGLVSGNADRFLSAMQDKYSF